MESEPAPTPAPAAPPAAEPAPAPAPVATPVAAAPCEVPEGELRGDAAAGGQLYALYCATCHGQGGKGDGPAAPKEPKPADHTDAAYMSTLSDEDVYCVISKGGASVGKSPLMTAWGMVLNDQQIRDLLAHVRSLSGS